MNDQEGAGRQFLISPEEDELLHSVGVRWHILSGSQSRSSSSVNLFGYETAYKNWDVPAGLYWLESASAGTILSSEATLRERSVLRAYLPLLPLGRRKEAINTCLTTSDASLAKAKTGLGRNNESTRFLRLCRYCVAESVKQRGFGYWKTTHQLPGTWICRDHRTVLSYVSAPNPKAKQWRLPEHCLEESKQPQIDVADTLKLLRVAEVIDWICSKRSVDPIILHVMLKLRLRIAGLCRSEIKLFALEVEHLTKLVCSHYKSIQTPDFFDLSEKNWFQTLYSESRHYNPLTWGMAIAFVGETNSAMLELQYNDAVARKPQPNLFGTHAHGKKRSRAPTQLYEAFHAVETKADAIHRTGLTASEIDGWLRRDQALGEHWRTTLKARKWEEAVEIIQAFVDRNPGCMRVNVLRNCNQAYRWLEANDPIRLDYLLPTVQAKYSRQLAFDFHGGLHGL